MTKLSKETQEALKADLRKYVFDHAALKGEILRVEPDPAVGWVVFYEEGGRPTANYWMERDVMDTDTSWLYQRAADETAGRLLMTERQAAEDMLDRACPALVKLYEGDGPQTAYDHKGVEVGAPMIQLCIKERRSKGRLEASVRVPEGGWQVTTNDCKVTIPAGSYTTTTYLVGDGFDDPNFKRRMLAAYKAGRGEERPDSTVTKERIKLRGAMEAMSNVARVMWMVLRSQDIHDEHYGRGQREQIANHMTPQEMARASDRWSNAVRAKVSALKPPGPQVYVQGDWVDD